MFPDQVFEFRFLDEDLNAMYIEEQKAGRVILYLSVLANVTAWPAAYFAMSEWLKNFPYRTGIHWLVFVLSACTAALVAFVTVVYQSIWAARANPADSLLNE